MAIYVDTGAWIALHESRDSHHDEARRQLAAIREDGELLVTGWHTVVELVDGLCHHYDQARAVKQLDRLRESPSVRIVDTESLRTEATSLLQDRLRWGIDLSDALSFAVMEHEGIDEAFTYDDDFEKAGFEIVG